MRKCATIFCDKSAKSKTRFHKSQVSTTPKGSKMHEYSIVAALIEQCESIAKQNNATKIDEITLSVGERSGVEIELLKRAFEAFAEESTICSGAKLIIERQEVLLECKKCGKQTSAQNLKYSQCAHCQSDEVEIIKGRDIVLMRLNMLEC